MNHTYLRSLVGAAMALVIGVWFFDSATLQQQRLLQITGLIFIALLAVQVLLDYSEVAEQRRLLISYAGDAALAGLLILATGGIDSPFAFLSGLIALASGLYAQRLLPQMTAVVACIGYLAGVYGHEWTIHNTLLDNQQALHALLQVSALLLVGGVMAYIARRHAMLSARGDQAQQQHRQLRDLYDRVMQSMHEGMVVLDEHMQLSDMNEAAKTLLGRMTLDQLLEEPAIRNFFEQPDSNLYQCDLKLNERMLLVRITRLAAGPDALWLLTLVDISQVRKLQKELLQQEKMAALGQMAAMLAHEVRNPIQTMAQGLEFIGSDAEQNRSIKAIMHDEMLRLNRLVSTMLDYSKPLTPAPVQIEVEPLLKASVTQAEIRSAVTIEWHCDVTQLYLDADHFRLVLDNLISNAVDNTLVTDSEGERVKVRIYQGEVTWHLDVCNPGTIDDEIKRHLFDPFVSGKSRGVGLGLATVRQVCKANGWLIDLKQPEGGTCFTITGVNASLAPEERRYG